MNSGKQNQISTVVEVLYSVTLTLNRNYLNKSAIKNILRSTFEKKR